MNHKDVLPTLDRCPNCKSKLKTVLYGMLAEKPGPDFIIGGCMIDGNEPHRECGACGWVGGFGGRPYETTWLNKWFVDDPENPGEYLEKSEVLDIREFDDEAVAEIARQNLIGRFELVFRGADPAVVDANYEDDLSMPLIAKQTVYAIFDSASKKINLVASFYAFRQSHIFTFVSPNADQWQAVASYKEFVKVLVANRGEEIQVWELNVGDDMTDEEFVNNNARFGSPSIAACWDAQEFTESELALEGVRLEPRVFWPDWFSTDFAYDYIWRS